LCLSPPTRILEQWAKRGLDRGVLERSIAEVSEWLDIAPIRASTFGSVTQRFTRAVETLQLPGRVEVMNANIASNCVGCGYCNIGCAYGAKLSMLETVLPWAQQNFGDRIEVLPDFDVTEVLTSGANAVGLRGTRRGTGASVTLTAKEHVIVAAGAIHSSCLLQRSDIKLRTIGSGVHFNINSPLTAEFGDVIDSFAGIQMSHVYVPEDDGDQPPFLIETWFNPPATQALAMPGWFDQHFTNMRRYRYMASGAALVGTSSPGRVKWTRFGPKITYRPSSQDLKSVVDGLKLTGRIFFEAGAIRVMPATHGWHAFTSAEELDGLDRIVRDNTDLLLSSAHPQGGNPLGTPVQGGVVGADFRVHGFENLYVCDASVFPSSVHVNPQLTVMGLAQYASQRIFV
jgi:choline dehydrogenase-like flavoprotein